MPIRDLPNTVSPRLGLWDTVSIVVGIVVGASIFKVPPLVLANTKSPWLAVAAWTLGGILSLIGALCYAELATTYPRSGGGYVYLTRAYGRWLGFLFGWAQLVAILTGSVAALSYVFGDYSAQLFNVHADWSVWFALGAVVGLTCVNLLGLAFGKVTQNLFTAAKVFGLGTIVVAGLFWRTGSGTVEAQQPPRDLQFGFAMILVLYAYGGWNDAAFVTAEVRNPRRNMPLALILGTLIVTCLYVLVNIAYLRNLGELGLQNSAAPAAELLRTAWGDTGAGVVSILVMVSTLGAVNGMLLSGARIYAEVGADHPLLGWLGQRNAKTGAPLGSLCAQAVVAVCFILLVGTEAGRRIVDIILDQMGFEPLPWDRYHGGFEMLVAGTAPVFWLFFLLTGGALFVLRIKDKSTSRPFAVPFFPILPAIFCATSVFMLYRSLAYAGALSLLGLAPLAVGMILYFVSEAKLRR